MEIINRIRLQIGGVSYTISTPESEEYVRGLAQEINASLREVMDKSSSLSVTDGLVLCMLDCMDMRKKSEASADHLRDQVTVYLEDSRKARDDADKARSEATRLKNEIVRLKSERGDAARKKAAATAVRDNTPAVRDNTPAARDTGVDGATLFDAAQKGGNTDGQE